MRGPPSTSVTTEPSDANAWAISTPTTPPPRISRRSGTVLVVVISRFVHGSASRSPSIGGISGSLPVATTTARRATSLSSPTATVRSPVIRPLPRTTSTPRSLHLAKVGTFDSPLYVISPPGDARRLMVVEQGGTIRVVRGGKKLAQPFLDIRSRVVSGGEQGLLSMAFARNYARSHRLWVYFTNRDGNEEIDAFRAASRDRADPGSA